jgi:hypothetical protein
MGAGGRRGQRAVINPRRRINPRPSDTDPMKVVSHDGLFYATLWDMLVLPEFHEVECGSEYRLGSADHY